MKKREERVTIKLTPAELTLVRFAVRACINDLRHDTPPGYESMTAEDLDRIMKEVLK